jgi:multidrug efflux pump subunit AcrA (membrane-fusion protein)
VLTVCEPDFEVADINFRKGWLRALMILGTLMLVSGLLWIRLDLTVDGEGVVEARRTARLYAARDARVSAIQVSAGQKVREGEVLLVLDDEALRRELTEVRLQRLTREEALRLAELRERELLLTGGNLELDLAAAALELQREQLANLEEVKSIFDSLAETGSVSRLELLDLDIRFLASRREQLLNQRRVDLQKEGMLELWLDVERSRQDAALRAIEVFAEREAVLEAEIEALTFRAPHGGRVTQVFVRDAGERVERGMLLASVADMSAGYEARIFVGDRNVDLIRIGAPVRLETPVFSSTAEGYMHGTVTRVVTDAAAAPTAGFELGVALETWPVEPVIGSRVTAEVILQRQGLIGLLFRRPDRPRPEPELPEEVIYAGSE